jgi:hypothetical protein
VLDAGGRAFEQFRVVGGEPLGEGAPWKIGEEGESNGLVERHERPPV